jgi:dethiobiotin synthetase
LLNECEAKRNQIVHSAYAVLDNEGTVNHTRLKITARQKNGLKITNDTISENDLREINEKIINTIKEVQGLYSHLFPDEIVAYA